jgi:hypothetical protein
MFNITSGIKFSSSFFNPNIAIPSSAFLSVFDIPFAFILYVLLSSNVPSNSYFCLGLYFFYFTVNVSVG